MKNVEPTDNPDFKHLQLFFYLLPVVGFFPSLWTLYYQDKSSVESFDPPSRQASRDQLAVSRLSVTLAGSWLLSYLLLSVGAETSEFLTLRLLVLNSFLTSGYFLASLWLMVRLWQRQPVRLAGFSRLAQMLGKYLS